MHVLLLSENQAESRCGNLISGSENVASIAVRFRLYQREENRQ